MHATRKVGGWRSEAVEAFIHAYLDALEWIAANQDATLELVGRELSLTDAVTSQMTLSAFSADGRIDPVLVQTLLDVAATPDHPAPRAEELYDETLLTDVLRER